MRPSLPAAILTFLASLSFAVIAAAQPPAGAPPAPESARAVKPLSPGDPAPALSIEKWLKGVPLNALQRGTIYVVEFWSPSSPGSVANIHRLTELQEQFKGQGVVVVGIVSRDPRTDLAAAEESVAERDETIGYTVGWDAQRATFQAYVEASGAKFLPTTFIIDRNGIVAHAQSGNDLELDRPLSEIVAGTFVITRRESPPRRTGRRSEIADLRDAVQRQDWPRLMALYENLRRDSRPAGAELVFEAMLLRQKNYTAASEFGRRIAEGIFADDPTRLNTLAWTIVNPENQIQNRDLDLALKAALRADQLTGGTNAAILDTVARVHFWKKDLAKALEVQKRAVAALTTGERPEIRQDVQRAMEEYRQALKAQ